MDTNKNKLYFNAYSRVLKTLENKLNLGEKVDLKSEYRKLITYGIKSINTLEDPQKMDIEYPRTWLDSYRFIVSIIEKLTPKEFMQLFPIEKTYNGEKHGFKDYFYTMKYINKIGIDKQLKSNTYKFLMTYDNSEIRIFFVNGLKFISILNKFKEQPNLV